MPLLLVCLCLLLAPAHGQEQFTVSQADLDSLRLPPGTTLTRLLGLLEQHLAGLDRPLFLQRRWQVISDFYDYETAKKEMVLLKLRQGNLYALWQLTQQQAAAAQVEDRQVLLAHNAFIDSELELLRKTAACRTCLLHFLDLCNVEILTDGAPATGITSSPKRPRK